MEIHCVHFSVHLVTRSYVLLDPNLQTLIFNTDKDLISAKRRVIGELGIWHFSITDRVKLTE